MRFTVKYGLSMVLLILGLFVYPQQGVIKGVVKEKAGSEPIPFCSIILDETGKGTSSDVNGFYIFDRLKPGSYTVRAFSMGYDTLSVEIMLLHNEQKVVNLSLTQLSYELETISISSEKTERVTRILISDNRITPEDINLVPSVGSMPDLVQKLQTIPGVVTRGDLGGQMYVRGGSPVQNKTLLDRAMIMAPVHAVGLFSVFEPQAIRSADFYSGGFSSKYGGAISSVLDISTRNGNTDKHHGLAEFSSIGSRFMFEGPIIKKKHPEGVAISFLMAAKFSHFDFAKRTYYQYLDQELPFSFSDFYSKVTVSGGDKMNASLFLFDFRDNAGIGKLPVDFRKKTFGAGGNINLMPQATSMLIGAHFAFSSYELSLNEMNLTPRKSFVDNWSLGFDFTSFSGDHRISYGLEMVDIRTDYLYYSNQENTTEQFMNNTEMGVYFDPQLKYGPILLNPGFRVQIYSSLNELRFEPRMGAKYLLFENFRLKAAVGYYSQNMIAAYSDRDIVNYFNGYLAAPVDFVRDKNGELPESQLQKSIHYIAGLEWEPIRQLAVNLEVYHKDYPLLINYNRNKLFNPISFPDQPEIYIRDFIIEQGYAQGLEGELKYAGKQIQATAGYAFSKTQRTFEQPDGSDFEYYPHYDQRHNLNLSFSWFWGNDNTWVFSARWNYTSGFPFTLGVGNYESNIFDETNPRDYLSQNGEMMVYYSELNGGRLPTYDRLDVSVRKRFYLKHGIELEAEINLINAYNQKNIYYVNRVTQEVIYQLPLLPGFRLACRI